MLKKISGLESTKGEEQEAEDRYDLVICPYENEENRTMKDCLRGQPSQNAQTSDYDAASASAKQVAVIIGPEGGFSDKEITMFGQCGASVQLVTLGKTILRTETAGLAALAMIMYELEL